MKKKHPLQSARLREAMVADLTRLSNRKETLAAFTSSLERFSQMSTCLVGEFSLAEMLLYEPMIFEICNRFSLHSAGVNILSCEKVRVGVMPKSKQDSQTLVITSISQKTG
jgi:hypothetical protein